MNAIHHQNESADPLCPGPRSAPPLQASWGEPTTAEPSGPRTEQQHTLPPERKVCVQEPAPFSEATSPQAGATAWHWSIGVTTAPRALPTLRRTLVSLAEAGWDDPHLFAEPGCEVPEGYAVTRRGRRMGAWPNWYLALAELVLKDPHADAYVLIQDDVLFSRNCRMFLEANLWPPDPVGLVSLYCPSIYHPHKQRSEFGPYAVRAGRALVGALTYFFPPAAARALLQDHEVAAHRLNGWHQGLCNIDSVIGSWAERSRRKVYYYAPSLATHIGEVSSIWLNHPPHPGRTSASFLGEQFDAASLIQR